MCCEQHSVHMSVICSTKFIQLWLFQFQQLYDVCNTLYIRKPSALQNVSSPVVQTLYFLEHSGFSRSVKLNLCLRKPSLIHNSYWYFLKELCFSCCMISALLCSSGSHLWYSLCTSFNIQVSFLWNQHLCISKPSQLLNIIHS